MVKKQSILRSALLLQVALLFPFGMNAQQDRMSNHIEFDTILFLPDEATSSWTDIVYARHGRKALFTAYNTNTHHDTISLYCVDADSLSCHKWTLEYHWLEAYMKKHYYHSISQIAFDDKRVFILFCDQLLQCHRDTDSTLAIDWQTTLPEPLRHMYLLDSNTLVFSQLYPVHPSHMKKKTAVSLMLYDIPSRSFTKKILPPYNTVLMAPLHPYNHMDIHNGQILWANRNAYSFTIYNSLLDSVQTVNCTDIRFEGIPQKTLDKITKKKLSGVDLNEAMHPLYHEYDHLDFVHFVNDSNIAIVRLDKTERINTRLDWWKKRGGEWHPAITNLDDKAAEEIPYTQPTARNNLQVGWHFGGKVILFEDKIIVISERGVPVSPIGISQEEYYARYNEWLVEHDTHIQITFIKHDFCK